MVGSKQLLTLAAASVVAIMFAYHVGADAGRTGQSSDYTAGAVTAVGLLCLLYPFLFARLMWGAITATPVGVSAAKYVLAMIAMFALGISAFAASLAWAKEYNSFNLGVVMTVAVLVVLVTARELRPEHGNRGSGRSPRSRRGKPKPEDVGTELFSPSST